MRFLKFINEAAVNVDMTDVNAKIKEIRQLKTIEEPAKGLDILNNIFKDLRISFGLRDGESNYGLVGGNLYSDGTIYIRLGLDYLNYIKSDFVNFAMLLSRILEHELIHREQDARVKFDKLPDVLDKHYQNVKSNVDAYYGSNIEIMAHANSIIRKLQHDGIEDSEILYLLKNIRQFDLEELPWHLGEYLERFKDNPKVLKRLYKYMYQYVIGDNKEDV